MKHHTLARGMCFMLIGPLSLLAAGSAPDALSGKVLDRSLTRSGTVSIMRRVADWQLAHPRHRATDWHNGPLFSGVLEVYKLTRDDKYLNALMEIGESTQWKPGGRLRHADDHVVGQFYLDLYTMKQDARMLEPIKARFDAIMADPKPGRSDWHWCDALYMAPPTLARLAAVTGEQKYLDFMNDMWWDATDYLYDKDEQLYFRDKRFFNQREANGKKVFWSRGNGWVMAGMVRILQVMPDDYPDRSTYINLFRDMASTIADSQPEDGLWRPSLLYPEGFENGETSGSGFFTYALAWGVNQGLLPEETYRPVVMKAWKALCGAVNEDGMLGYVQQVDYRPQTAKADAWEVYGSGAFLLAGSEVVHLLKDETVRVFTGNAGWCWFQDPRVILHDGKLVMGGVQGNGAGSAIVGVYDLDAGRNLGQVVMHEGFDRDDHNAPAFYRRPDGRLLAVYARHNRDGNHYYRFSGPDNYLEWGEEHIYRHDYPRASHVTYMNLEPMPAEGRLYNFYRGIAFNPCFITSQDQGETWGEPTHFIANEAPGRQRPYARYVGNGADTVHVSFTDAHPRDYPNSIYYAAFRGGTFYRANGEQIKDLKQAGPLLPGEADKVFEGGTGKTPEGTVEKRAWTSSIALDADEHPHLAYSVHRSNSDHRYRMAFWDGVKWIDREVAYAGNCLYARESSYTGLITLDPGDPTFVVLSTDVNPSTGADSGGKHEVYCARVAPDDDISTIQWKPLTQDSEMRNIRPIIVRDDTRRVILWLRGRFSTYTDYELDVVGMVQRMPE